ncbi:MAG: hypothetical protein C0417_11490 [Chlorobiaceae bacterium]|nr:hypothetical protein [Chlorobiaceae bacterium]
MKEQKPKQFIRDLRAYSKQTFFRLILGSLAIIIIVGLGLIYIFYGKGAVITGFLCISSGLLPIVVILLVFQLIDFVIKKSKNSK